MAKKIYKLGVLGLGEGRSIISAALQSTQWELVNMCDMNEVLCKERASEFGLNKYTLDYEDLLKDSSIEVIGIYTPDQLHGKHIIQALEAGKHVICTKPVLTSLEEAEKIIECQKKTKCKVFVGQSSRFFEPMLHQREDFEKGLHGEITSVETHYITDARWFLKKDWSLKKGFSFMYNFLIHAVDLVCWYYPEIEEVYAMSNVSTNTTAYGINVPDTLKLLLKDSKGRTGLALGSYAVPCLEKIVEPSISCTLRGTKGVSRGEYQNLIYHTSFENQEPTTHDFSDKRDYYFRFGGDNHHAGEYQNYIEYFADCLDADLTPKPDLKEAFNILAVMEAIEKSIETGLPVKVKDIISKYEFLK